MSVPPAASDAELVARVADGEQAAYLRLFERHGDRVHDHVARWSRDAALAADATRTAFVALLRELDAPVDPGALNDVAAGGSVFPWLLRTARTHAIGQLQQADVATTGPDTRVPTAVLAGTVADPSPAEVTALSHETSELVWEVVAGLDERSFTAVDLHVRQGLSDAELAEVTGRTPTDAGALVQRARDEVETLFAAAHLLQVPVRDCSALGRLRAAVADPLDLQDARTVRDHAEGCVTCGPRRARAGSSLRSYAAMAPVRAPLAVRSGVAAAAAEHFGTVVASGSRVHRGVIGAVLLGLLLVAGGVATALRHVPDQPVDGPPAVVAEPVPSPSPVPTPTPTLDVLPSPPAVPSPEPTAEVDPSPSPSPTPSPVPLAVTISDPAAGASTLADRVDEATDRVVGVVDVVAEVEGGGEQVTMAWRSLLEPGNVLLQGRAGQVQLWLTTSCQDTRHPLEVTATDAATGQTSTAVVEVLVEHTCATPVEVTVQQPADGTELQATEDEGRTAVVEVAATANDEGLDWRWTSPQVPDGVLLEAASGQVRLTVEGCDPVAFTLTATAERQADGSTGSGSTTVTVVPACPT